ncbi:type II toxin-antitoxin system VapC family toxin [Halovenus salina]|uniref:type II toxin-antitoxin system VapC family toxin n=1 Tax=Halovenus salina TaxID=1510225 RepID=UPI002260EA05|nr:PIN domain-containing protein [Halovenus salina]
MPDALLDTNVLFASASARDEYHERSREIIREIDHGALPTAVVTNYVVAETLNITGEKLTPQAANGMLDRLVEGTHFKVEHTPKADFNAAQAIFRRYDELSFVDATIAAYMDREDIDYLYSLDDDFDALDDVSRLDTAENPYR